MIVKKSTSSRDNINLNSENSKFKRQKTFSYNSSASNTNSNYLNSSIVVFKVKNEKKDEDYWIAKNYIKMLRQSEFYMI